MVKGREDGIEETALRILKEGNSNEKTWRVTDLVLQKILTLRKPL